MFRAETGSFRDTKLTVRWRDRAALPPSNGIRYPGEHRAMLLFGPLESSTICYTFTKNSQLPSRATGSLLGCLDRQRLTRSVLLPWKRRVRDYSGDVVGE